MPEKKQKSVICSRCKERKATVLYSADVLSFTHGFTENICRPCYIKILEHNINTTTQELINQKRLLKNEKTILL